jgi:hypothetical protein
MMNVAHAIDLPQNVVTPLAWALVGAVASVVAERVFQWLSLQLRVRKLLAIFDFVEGELIFIVPHRDRDPQSIMPRAAFEDLMALKNVVSIVTKLHRSIDIKIKDPMHLTADDYKKNLISLGGGKVNTFSDSILQHHGFHFEQDNAGKGWILRRRPSETRESLSYAVSDDEPATVARGDSAVVLKAPNLHNPSATVLVIAGVRGIGTWGAGDCLRKSLDEIYQLKRRRKSGDFFFFVDVQYSDFDITAATASGFEDLPDRKASHNSRLRGRSL